MERERRGFESAGHERHDDAVGAGAEVLAPGCSIVELEKMLSNAYVLAKFRFDTAENEPAKNLQNFANFPNFAIPNP